MSDHLTLRDLIEAPRAGYWGSSNKTTTSNVPCRVVRNGDVGHDGLIDVEALPIRWFTSSEVEKAKIDHGDSVLVSSGAYTGNVGRISGQSAEPVVISNFVRLLRAQLGVEPRFLFQLVRSNVAQIHVWPNTGGSAIPNLSPTFYSSVILPARLSNHEQRVVATILDTLDTAIRETEALIDKLKAVKQGLLHDLLTRGIDANGQLRPPQSEAPQLYKESLLGWIPREWVIHAVSDIARVTVGHVGPIEEHFSEDDGSVPLLSTTSIGEDGRLHGEPRYVSASFDRTHGNSHLSPDDLIVARHGKSGLTAVVPEKISAAQSLNVVIVRASPMFISGFLAASLNHPPTRSRLLGDQAGSVQPIVGTRAVAALEVAIPGREEQLAIWERNEALMNKIDLEVQHAESLRAIKQGLMDDLLTGRVRVTPLLEPVQQTAAQTGA